MVVLKDFSLMSAACLHFNNSNCCDEGTLWYIDYDNLYNRADECLIMTLLFIIMRFIIMRLLFIKCTAINLWSSSRSVDCITVSYHFTGPYSLKQQMNKPHKDTDQASRHGLVTTLDVHYFSIIKLFFT